MNCFYECYSSVGGRSDNEDSLLAVEKDNDFLFVVADGLGGDGNGGKASKIAVNELKRQFLDCKSFSLDKAICQANNLIIQNQDVIGCKMKTTCVAILVESDKTIIANVGDSRAYFFDGNKIIFQTIDHSASQMAVNLGRITAEQIRGHEDRSILTRALGNEDVKIDITVIDNLVYDRILICSDGFWEYVIEEEMIRAIIYDNPKDWLNKMIRYRNEKAPINCDNNTAIAVIKR